MNRLLALPAVLCLVLGAGLGAWGWTQRDEARARIVPDFSDDGGGPFSRLDDIPEDQSPFADQGPEATVCFDLMAAAQLDPALLSFLAGAPGPAEGSSEGPPESVATPVTDPLVVGRTLAAILDPATVAGIPSLDRPDLVPRMWAMSAAVEAALAAGRDPLGDAAVQDAAAVLRPVVDDAC